MMPKREGAETSAASPPIRVRVAHGSLDRRGLPVAVGHYDGDEIIGAEAFLDRCLGKRLQRRNRLGQYPGPVGTTLVLSAPKCSPPGALVIGLGDVGELTAGNLSLGFEKAILELALEKIEERWDAGQKDEKPEAIGLASLLIGTRGGRQLTARQAILAMLRGALAARRLLEREGLDDQVYISELTFVELWADVAITAAHALRELKEDERLGALPPEEVDIQPKLLVSKGGRSYRPYSGEEWSWWRRLIVTEEKMEGQEVGNLRFVSVSNRARAEDRLVSAHRNLVHGLLARAQEQSVQNEVSEGSVVNALLELLLPVGIKANIFAGSQLVLMVDRAASRYPWELLARRKGDDIQPLISKVSLIRQFRTEEFREVVRPARSNAALVIGDPDLVHWGGQLPGAAQEAGRVAELMRRSGFEAEPLIKEKGNEILQHLYRTDYRVVHIAAHGEYREGDPDGTGVVIGIKGTESGNVDDESLWLLPAAAFQQMGTVPELVFLNCCHLGKIDQKEIDDFRKNRPEFAASVAQALIEMGVRCVVVAGWQVGDTSGLIFSLTFYHHLLAGRTFGEAVDLARRKVWKARGTETTTWGAYQCYGDPVFRLIPPRSRSANHDPGFHLSEGELQNAVLDLIAKAANMGDSLTEREEVRERLTTVERALEAHPEWGTGGRLLFRLAEAWRHTGEYGKAIELYRMALRSSDGEAPLQAAEHLADMLDLHDQGDLDVETLTELERSSNGGDVSLADAWMAWAGQIEETPRRAEMRGVFLKRRARRVSAAKRKKLLTQAVEAFREALGASPTPEQSATRYGTRLHAAAAAWAKPGGRYSKEVKGWLKDSRASALNECKDRGETLRNRLAVCEADLLEQLWRKEFGMDAARELRYRYRKVLQTIGSVHDRDTARNRLEFLIECADRKPTIQEALRVVREAFLEEGE